MSAPSFSNLDCLKEASDVALRNELARRKEAADNLAATRQVREDLVTTLTACIYAIKHPPNGQLSRTDQAIKLVYELAYRCLPGGNVREKSGMDGGWLSVGETSGSGRYDSPSHVVLARLLGMPPGQYAKENPRLIEREF